MVWAYPVVVVMRVEAHVRFTSLPLFVMSRIASCAQVLMPLLSSLLLSVVKLGWSTRASFFLRVLTSACISSIVMS